MEFKKEYPENGFFEPQYGSQTVKYMQRVLMANTYLFMFSVLIIEWGAVGTLRVLSYVVLGLLLVPYLIGNVKFFYVERKPRPEREENAGGTDSRAV